MLFRSVLLLDDLIATGGSMGAAITLCEKVGYQVVALACLIDLVGLNRFQHGEMTVRSVIQFND